MSVAPATARLPLNLVYHGFLLRGFQIRGPVGLHHPRYAVPADALEQADKRAGIRVKIPALNPDFLTPGMHRDSFRRLEFNPLDPRTLWQLTKDRVVPSMKIGKCVRYRVADLDDWTRRQIGKGA